MIDFVFTEHAAARWYQRFPDADVKAELESATRQRQYEKKYCRNKHRKARAYITKSGIALICKGKTVLTCLHSVNFSPYEKAGKKY